MQVMRNMPSVQFTSPTLAAKDFPPPFVRSSSSKFSLSSSGSVEDISPITSPTATPPPSSMLGNLPSVPSLERLISPDTKSRSNSEVEEKVQISHCMSLLFF